MKEAQPDYQSAQLPDTAKPMRWLCAIACFPLIYVFSIGPAAWLSIKVPSTQPILEIIYLPIGQLCDSFPQAGEALLWYVEVVWRVPIAFPCC